MMPAEERSSQSALVGWDSVRSVKESGTYEAERDRIAPRVQRFDEVMRGVYWALASRPQMYPAIAPDSAIHVLKTADFGDIPALRIFFTFSDSHTALLWIEVI